MIGLMNSMKEKDIEQQDNLVIKVVENPWQNVYWFSRMLINTDKYGAIGGNSKLMSTMASSLRLIQQQEHSKSTDEILLMQKSAIESIIKQATTRAKSKADRISKLITDLNIEIKSNEDMQVFILTCENIMIPLNQAIENIPSDDKAFSLAIAEAYLNVRKDDGLATVINLWDDFGIRGSLTAERTEIVRAFTTLRTLLAKDKMILEDDRDIILSAFTQEFERRAGQKRKGRAGGSLEDVTDFILKHYKIPAATMPEHFQADIEVDKWVKSKDGWLIGISCKRTLRERWKQVSSASAETLSNYKIKYIYHVVTYDEDLSDDKLALLGGLRHIFYLPDSSRRLKHAREHVGLKSYVRPISQFINDLKKEMKIKS